MPKISRRFKEIQARVDFENRYTTREALELVADLANTKFDESIDVSIRLGVNPRHADQMVRGACSLPHGTGKTVRVLVFAQGEAARAATEAGADFVGSDDLVQKIQNEGWLEFDKVVATRGMMGKVGRLGRVLGPRGLMPNPKVGTVVSDDQVSATVKELKQGKISFRVEKAGVVHASIGKASMGAEKLEDNFLALIAQLLRMKPSTAKGTYVKGVSISSTMGPGIRVDTIDAQRHAEGR
jgi:large subunit ribosomal protein L1